MVCLLSGEVYRASSIYTELKGWQSGIGSLLGLLAIIIGALYNFHLNRKRDNMLRLEEKLSVAAAVYGEILLLRNEIVKFANLVSKRYVGNGTGKLRIFIDCNFLEANYFSEPFVYKALASKLGLLDAHLIVSIAEFYSKFDETKKSLPLLVEREGRDFSYSPLAVLLPARDAIVNITPALISMERMLNIQKHEPIPDIRITEDVIEMEQDFFETPVPE